MFAAIAVISDIHSNKNALEAVLRDADGRNIDLIVNLGDSLFGPVDPLGTARLLMQRDNIVNIMGNCDELLLQDVYQSLTFNYVKPLLQTVHEDWIKDHKYSWSYSSLLFCHGTPWNNSRYLLEQIAPSGDVIYKRIEQLTEELQSINQQIIFCGHSHVYHSMSLPEGKLVVNPGSVGLPAYQDEEPFPHTMESGTPYASYCICRRDLIEEESWNIEHILVKYDWNEAAAQAEQNGRLDYAHPIRTGKVAPNSP
ncbi:MAG: metallophosphatase family protein [Paenibacillus sp.]|nr:metallophosphatase family protein [Paenibacillus sp.]